MSTLCRFVLPSQLSSIEDSCVAEFNEYKKRMKEISQNKSSNKRFTNLTGGITTNLSGSESSHHKKDTIKDPEQAKEVAKKLVQSGAIKVLAQGKDQGFKRASSSSSNTGQERIIKKIGLTPTSSSSPLNQTNPFQSISFVSPTSTPKLVHNNSHDNKRRVINYDDTDDY